MLNLLCCTKANLSYERIVNHFENFRFESHINELDVLQEKLINNSYDLAIIDEKLWWLDEGIELLNKQNIKVIVFKGNFDEIINEITEQTKVIEELFKEEILKENQVEKPKQPEIKYVYITENADKQANARNKSEDEAAINELKKQLQQAEENAENLKERITEKGKPKDYKKTVGIIGIPNAGKSFIILQTASYLSASIKVAIIDRTDNQDFSYYFKEDTEEPQSPIKINKNLHLYTSAMNISSIIDLDKIKQNYDLIMVDLQSNDVELDVQNNKSILMYLDNLYVLSDCDPTHTKIISQTIKDLLSKNVSHKKIRIIFNKVIVNSQIKYIYGLLRYDTEEDILPKIDYYVVNMPLSEKVYKDFLKFSPDAYIKDDIFNQQIIDISKDMYSVGEERTGFLNKIIKKRF